MTDPKVSLHSIRHLYRDLLVEAGATRDLIDKVMGHGPSYIGAGYGGGAGPEALWKIVKRIKWPTG